MKTKKVVFIIIHSHISATGRYCHYWELWDARQKVTIISDKNYTSYYGAVRACKRYAAKNSIIIG